MRKFTQALQQQLAYFSDFSNTPVEIQSDLFTIKRGAVRDFLTEIERVGAHLATQESAAHSEYYAERLIKQVDLLKQAVEKQQKTANSPTQFVSHYRFPKNIHNLPPERRLAEYKKALRILNEKLAWLSTQCYTAEGEQRELFVAQLAETEYRKMKCLKVIEELE